MIAEVLLMGAAAIQAPNPSLLAMGVVAGEYYKGDGLGLNWSLTLTQDGTFSFTWDGCLGRYLDAQGRFQVNDGVVEIAPSKPLDQEFGALLPLKFVVVPWADRLYLLPETDIPVFASFVGRGWEPRSQSYGLFLLRRSDWAKAVKGSPQLPSAWRTLLLSKPVEGRVTRVLAMHRAEVDLGSEQAIQAGMLLKAVSRKHEWFDARVVSVGRGSSIVEAAYGDPPFARGQRVTSRAQ